MYQCINNETLGLKDPEQTDMSLLFSPKKLFFMDVQVSQLLETSRSFHIKMSSLDPRPLLAPFTDTAAQTCTESVNQTACPGADGGGSEPFPPAFYWAVVVSEWNATAHTSAGDQTALNM